MHDDALAVPSISDRGFLKELAWRVLKEANDDNVFALAAQVSYYFVLALFPFFIFLAALAGTLPFTDLWQKVLKWIVLYLPWDSQHFLLETIVGLTSGRHFLSVGLLGTAWASCTGIMNLMTALNGTYEVKESRSFWHRLGLSLAILFVGSFFFLGCFGLLTMGEWIGRTIVDNVGSSPLLRGAWHMARWTVSLIMLGLGMSFVYNVLPNLKRRWHWFNPGTLFVILMWVPAGMGFNLYAHYVASYNKTYGALGAFVIVMLWIYLSTLITLVGAEINCELHKLQEESRQREAETFFGGT